MPILFRSIAKVGLAAALIVLLAPPFARAQLYTISSIGGWWDYDPTYIRQVNPATGATISINWITLPPGTYGMFTTGLATHTSTGEIFTLVHGAPTPTSQCQHKLAKIIPTTGVAAIIGNTRICFASLAFHANGTLYGVTDDSLVTINTTNASTTFLISFATGRSSGPLYGGPALAFNPNDGLLYRSATLGGGGQVFQSIDPSTLVVTDIPLSGSSLYEIASLTHSSGNTFLGADVGNRLFSVTSSGVSTLIGSLDHLARGLAFATTLAPFTPPLNIGATTLAAGEAGVSFTGDLMISGGVAPYIVSITKGALPAGLSLGNDGIISGTISPAAKSANFTVRITDSLNDSVTKTFKMTILRALSVSARAGTGRVGRNYHASFRRTGGLGPFTWSISAGALPTGLLFNTATGVITGIPAQAGTFPLTVQVTDALGGVDAENLTLTIN